MALTDNLLFSYECDESSGDLIDAHGGLTVPDFGSPGTTSGVISGARVCSASNYFTASPSDPWALGDVDFSWDVWIRASAVPSASNMRVFRINGKWALLWPTSGSSGHMQWNVGSTFLTLNHDGGTASADVTHHLHLWHDATNNVIGYRRNGGTEYTTAHTAGLGGTSANNFDVGHSWDGWIDMFRGWNRLLTTDEKNELYNSGAGLAYSGFGGGGGGFQSAWARGSNVLLGAGVAL